jgi:hypothetical protein
MDIGGRHATGDRLIIFLAHPFLPSDRLLRTTRAPTYLLTTEDVDREGDYDDIEDKRAERLKNTGSPMNP